MVASSRRTAGGQAAARCAPRPGCPGSSPRPRTTTHDGAPGSSTRPTAAALSSTINSRWSASSVGYRAAHASTSAGIADAATPAPPGTRPARSRWPPASRSRGRAGSRTAGRPRTSRATGVPSGHQRCLARTGGPAHHEHRRRSRQSVENRLSALRPGNRECWRAAGWCACLGTRCSPKSASSWSRRSAVSSCTWPTKTPRGVSTHLRWARASVRSTRGNPIPRRGRRSRSWNLNQPRGSPFLVMCVRRSPASAS